MIKLLAGLAGYKNIAIIFGVAMLANTTITAYFTAEYKEGQFAIAQQKAQQQYNKIKDEQQSIINQYAEQLEKAKARVKVKTRIVEKKVIQYVETKIRENDDRECFDDAGLELRNDIIKSTWPVSELPGESTSRMRDIAAFVGEHGTRRIAMASGSGADLSGLLF